MKRKCIALCCMVMSLALLILSCVTASAASIVDSGSCGDNVTYTLDSNGSLKIIGTGPMQDFGYGESPWDSDETVKNVMISNGVTSIGARAFNCCTGLTSITIPDSVTSIGYCSFSLCSGLTSITIPDSVTSITERAFSHCTGLASITIPDSVTSIGDCAFDCCTGLASISVAKNNTVYYSAGNCLIETATKTLVLGCKNSVFPSDGSVTSIDSFAFDNCLGLTNITIPGSVTSISDYAFLDCADLASISVAKNNTVYHSTGNCLIETATNKLVLGCNNSVIPSDGSVTCITEWAFSRCTGLTSITIPESVTNIEGDVFYDCTGLTSITVLAYNVDTSYSSFFGISENCTFYCHEGSSVLNSYSLESSNIKFVAIHVASDMEILSISPTCTDSGEKYQKCKYCNAWRSVEIPALGHDFTGIARTNADGSISYKCTRCDEYGGTVKPAEKKLDEVTGTKRLIKNNVDILVAPVEMTASTVLSSANGARIVDKNGNEITYKNTPLATGMKVLLGNNSVAISVAGDVDGSGDISVSDARLALRAAVKLDTLSDAYFASADVDFSGDISVSDARLILRAAVKLDDPKKAWIK